MFGGGSPRAGGTCPTLARTQVAALQTQLALELVTRTGWPPLTTRRGGEDQVLRLLVAAMLQRATVATVTVGTTRQMAAMATVLGCAS